MSQIPITNVVNVSVSQAPAGLAAFQVNNLAIFSKETPVASPYGTYRVYASASAVAADWGSSSETAIQAALVFSQTPNILNGDGSLIVYALGSSEVLADALTTLSGSIFFGGALWAGYAPNNTEIGNGAVIAESLRVKLFISSYLTSDVAGLFTTIKLASEHHARCLLYTVDYLSGGAGSALSARMFAAAYAGRALSVNFNGSNTTSTMHMKDLVGVTADTGITQTILTNCETAGVDTLVSIGGLSKVYSTGGNDFFDNVYNLDWMVFALQVSGFNAIATTSTKLPQTEPGMSVLKGAYIQVLQQAVANAFIAPGSWNSPELFGNPADLKRNVLNIGYYIYSQPVNQQSQASRAARIAPVVQIAIKFAGAIQSSDVIVAFNP